MSPTESHLPAFPFRTRKPVTESATWHGDEFLGPKPERSTRMMFHNVNGLSLNGCEGIEMFVNNQLSLDIDLQGIAEHCLDTTKYQVKQALQRSFRSHSPQKSVIAFHSSTDPATNYYKPGGTGVVMLGSLVGRLESNGVHGDAMGRWTAVHLRRRDRKPITVIMAYQVCPRPTNILGNTAFHQQVRFLNQQGRSHIHPRQAFINDLQTYIGRLQQQGNDIILGGDFNESLTDRHSGIHRLVSAQNLVDPFLIKFQAAPTFGTHQLGSRRIDLLFVSPALLAIAT
jgi:exonuclease III